jgi:2-iminobutanoate/2-iminopropanoate deaminase
MMCVERPIDREIAQGGLFSMKANASLVQVVTTAICWGWLSLVCSSAAAEDHQVVNIPGQESLPLSGGVVAAGKTLYVSGMQGTDASGRLVAGGIGAETKAALENIAKIVKAAGFDLKDLVSVTVYLADAHEFADMNAVYRGFLPDPKPARATTQVAALVNNARIEISAIAVRQKQ